MCWDVHQKRLRINIQKGCQDTQARSRLWSCHWMWKENTEEKTERPVVKCSENRWGKKEANEALLNTPEQVVPVRTHCNPLIGSFLIPLSTQCQRIDGKVSGCQEPARPHWHRIKAGTNAAPRQSGKPEHTQGWEHPKTWPHSSCLYHQGVIGTWAFQNIFKGNLIHMCTMKYAVLYPAFPTHAFVLPPICNSGILHLPCLFSLLSFPINPSRGKSLSLQNCPRFDHNI